MGYAGANRADVRNWLGWGRPLDAPVPGCVVVLSRGTLGGRSGHVGFLVSAPSPGILRLLGGNQSNKVREGDYPSYRLLGCRWLTGVPLPSDEILDVRPVHLSPDSCRR